MMSLLKSPHGNLDELEATHSLEEVKAMARERGISPAGTKHKIATRLFGRGRPPLALPQVSSEYSWHFLQNQPYGLSMWDIALINGVSTVVFMARERKAELLKLPLHPDAMWKALSFGMEINGHKVMPVVVMIFFVPLQTIYEVYFNFYGETGEQVREAFRLLGKQTTNYLIFHDRGEEPIRKFGFDNSMDEFFRGHYGMINALPEWSDADFNEAKRQLMAKYTGDQLWKLK